MLGNDRGVEVRAETGPELDDTSGAEYLSMKSVMNPVQPNGGA